MRSILHLFLVTTSLCGSLVAFADDWERFRGKELNGISPESNWSSLADVKTPTKLWTSQVGTGLSGVVTSDGLLFTIGNVGNKDVVHCLDASNGKAVWEFSYLCALDPNEFEGGPTSTPTVDGDLLFTLSRLGRVHCFDKKTGKLHWSKNPSEENDIRVPGWGFAGSPLVVGDLVLLNIGEAAMALEKSTGKLKWKSADKDAGYSSLVPFRVKDTDAVVFGSARSYVCVEIESGKELWRQRWLTTFGCNAADPIVSNGMVFISSGYNRGAALLDVTQGDPRVVWKNKEMQNQISTSLLMNGFVYGIHGDVDAGTELRCVELETGEVQWSDDSFQPSALAAAADRLIVITRDGELVIATASAKELAVLSKHPLIAEKCWTSPVLSGGLLYVRSASGELTCVDMKQVSN